MSAADLMWRSAFGWLAPAGPRARLSTLIFHRVFPQTDPLLPGEVTAAQFDQICAWMRRWFNVLPLDQAIALCGQDRLPERALAISFDDGYADNCEVALPILQRHGLNATFFVATGFLDGGTMWNDRVIEALRATRATVLDLDGLAGSGPAQWPLATVAERRAAMHGVLRRLKHLPPEQRRQAVDEVVARLAVQLPENLMMRSDQVRQLRDAGMGIGGHTVNHPILAALEPAAALREITEGRLALERLLSERVGLFAYPNGKPGEDFTDAHVDMVREAGFDAAVTTAWGYGTPRTERHRVPRFTPWDRSAGRFGLRLARNLMARP